MRLVLAAAALFSSLIAQTPSVSASGENMRLKTWSVSGGGGVYTLTLQMDDDNGDASLPTSFRRWWHCEVGNLTPGTVLNVRVTNAGYSDVILPVWSLSSDGVQFGGYTRLPTSAAPTVQGGTQHWFSVTVPPGVVAMRLAKFFPYTVTRKDALLASVAGDPRVRSIVSLGSSQQGRPIEKVEWTDSSQPDAGKQRIWIHAGVHPAETTGHLMVEGLFDWLRSGELEAELLLDHALVEVVPMANPDGVHLGNYRTNANSSNLEAQWSAPYNSPQPEVVALRAAIEGYMGTAASPASNPIRVLLNLHSTHNIAFPFHFRHVANANWTPGCSSCGVIPQVHQLESEWITNFEARSPLVALGTTAASTLGSRPFVESMCHDRWTAAPGWLGAPNFEAPVMAITFEGTYGRGPNGVSWSTEADYLQCGREMGRALFDQLGLGVSASASVYGAACQSVTLTGALALQPDQSHALALIIALGPPNGLAALAVGGAPALLPFPSPWSGCDLLVQPDATLLLPLSLFGTAISQLTLPPVPGLVGYLQAVALDLGLNLDASNGLRVQNDY
ncbi:MAG: M14 family zinc carboxypeptidase [Planctomycetota bacterium]|nr:M14 family zinc carboxypeptidase [Planctomycetota bacterium]